MRSPGWPSSADASSAAFDARQRNARPVLTDAVGVFAQVGGRITDGQRVEPEQRGGLHGIGVGVVDPQPGQIGAAAGERLAVALLARPVGGSASSRILPNSPLPSSFVFRLEGLKRHEAEGNGNGVGRSKWLSGRAFVTKTGTLFIRALRKHPIIKNLFPSIVVRRVRGVVRSTEGESSNGKPTEGRRIEGVTDDVSGIVALRFQELRSSVFATNAHPSVGRPRLDSSEFVPFNRFVKYASIRWRRVSGSIAIRVPCRISWRPLIGGCPAKSMAFGQFWNPCQPVRAGRRSDCFVGLGWAV